MANKEKQRIAAALLRSRISLNNPGSKMARIKWPDPPIKDKRTLKEYSRSDHVEEGQREELSTEG